MSAIPSAAPDVPPTVPADAPPTPSASGRERMVRNVLSSWGSHFILIIAGFVLPRLIDERLGQMVLGLWDFAWSLVAYFSLVQGGIVSAINRYVARHRAAGEIDAMNCVVSSVTVVLWVMGIVVVLLSIATTLLMPIFWSERLYPHVATAQWVVLLLGLSIAVQIAGSSVGGVLTGCHRWDWHNGIYAATSAVTTVAMVTALLIGGSLISLALIHLLGEICGRSFRWLIAYRVCPELKIEMRRARWPVAREMLIFGQKSFVPTLGELLANQTVAIIIVTALGPMALAVFARPRALVRHVTVLVSRFANVLAPTASALQAAGSSEELRSLCIRATRYGGFVAVPLILGLTILGDTVMHVWMGPGYEQGLLVAVLAIGSLGAILALPMISVLTGLNAHGRPGVANLLASIATAGLVWPAVYLMPDGLLGAALAVSIPATIVGAGYIPWYTCRVLNMPLRQFFRKACLPPLLCSAPLVVCLIAARVLFGDRPLLAFIFALGAGGLCLSVVYWRFALPDSMRRALLERLHLRRTPREAAA